MKFINYKNIYVSYMYKRLIRIYEWRNAFIVMNVLMKMFSQFVRISTEKTMPKFFLKSIHGRAMGMKDYIADPGPVNMDGKKIYNQITHVQY